MRMMDLAVVYLIVGCGCAWALRTRRNDVRSIADVVLSFMLWPLYVPVLLGGEESVQVKQQQTHRGSSPRAERERVLLEDAVESARKGVQHESIASLLPTPSQLAALIGHLASLDAKVHELDEVLAREEFDPARVERRLRDGDRTNTEAATAALEGARRLVSLRDRAIRERDELLGLCARLRMQVTVLRFTDSGTSEPLADLMGEVRARIEGVGAALEQT
jgi:hypothetical protein